VTWLRNFSNLLCIQNIDVISFSVIFYQVISQSNIFDEYNEHGDSLLEVVFLPVYNIHHCVTIRKIDIKLFKKKHLVIVLNIS